MGTLAEELATHAGLPDGPRIYADANVPAGVVAFMRQRLHWDVLYVIEHDDLRRAPDRRHFALARQLQRTLITLDRDYLDDQRYPPSESAGLIVAWAPNEALLSNTLAELDTRVFHHDSGHLTPLPLEGRKLVADPSWVDR
ncbi:MAG TPA: DUF5615 family PIN-like protein [Vicinamibacterales bacterium]|nr:DUF5615 family PIN-like protein [Vicinamibacterales bacterium]